MCGFCDPNNPDLPEPDPDYWHDEQKEKEAFGD